MAKVRHRHPKNRLSDMLAHFSISSLQDMPFCIPWNLFSDSMADFAVAQAKIGICLIVAVRIFDTRPKSFQSSNLLLVYSRPEPLIPRKAINLTAKFISFSLPLYSAYFHLTTNQKFEPKNAGTR